MKKIPIHTKIIVILLAIPLVCLSICLIPNRLLTPPPPDQEANPNWSPDGKRIAYLCFLEGPTEGATFWEVVIISELEPPGAEEPWSQYTRAAADICLVDADGNNFQRLTRRSGGVGSLVWSPDGSHIAYYSADGLKVIDANGDNQRLLVPYSKLFQTRIEWTSDGRSILSSACLDKPDLDLYLINVNSGALTNLTPNSIQEDTHPSWILNGSKIFYLSTPPLIGRPCWASDAVPSQMKVMNADGSEERAIYKALYYPSVSVSNTGHIAFVSDLISTTYDEYFYGKPHLYIMNINETEPTEIMTTATSSRVYQWSPDGRYLIYEDIDDELEKVTTKLWDMHQGKIRKLPPVELPVVPGTRASFSIRSSFGWSPDGKQLAATGFLYVSKSRWSSYYASEEKHIYLFNLQDNTSRQLVINKK